MNANDKIKLSLDDLIAERDRLNEAIEALQRIVDGESGATGGEDIGNAPSPRTSTRSSSQIAIRPDDFFGMSQTEAAYAYLKKVGYAVHLDQMLDALRAGGVKFTGKDPKTNLYTVLVRGTRRFVLVSPSTFGLVEFYPNRPKKEPKKKKKGRKKGSRKKAGNEVSESRSLPAPKSMAG